MATDSRTTDSNLSERSRQAFLLDDAGFLRELVRRGLRGVRLVVSDDHEGLVTAHAMEQAAEWAAQTQYLAGYELARRLETTMRHDSFCRHFGT